jgi:putative transposase
MDEVYLTINGTIHYLWRGVDQDGHILHILVQSRRYRHAATRFFRELPKGLRYVPRVLMTDKLKSYASTKPDMVPGAEYRQHQGLNNRAEVWHQPTRQKERPMHRFKSPGARHRAFYPPTGPSTNFSAAGVIGSPAPTTIRSSAGRFRSCRRSLAPRVRPESVGR